MKITGITYGVKESTLNDSVWICHLSDGVPSLHSGQIIEIRDDGVAKTALVGGSGSVPILRSNFRSNKQRSGGLRSKPHAVDVAVDVKG